MRTLHKFILIQIRRLRIQQRIRNAELGILNEEQENELPDFPSFIPFLPPLVSKVTRLSVCYICVRKLF